MASPTRPVPGIGGARRGKQPGGIDMPYTDLELAATRDADRARGMDRRHELARALRESPVEPRPWLRLATRLLAHIRPVDILTPDSCQLPSGERGRSVLKLLDGEWTPVCVPDPLGRISA